MRPITFVAGIVLLSSGCASQLPLTDISVEPVPSACLSSLSGYDTLVAITNHSNRKVAFPAYGESGPPFRLYPGAFQVLAAEPGTNDFAPWHVVLDEFDPPNRVVTLAPGDRAEFVVGVSSWPDKTSLEIFKLEVRDSFNLPHLSPGIGVCTARSVPNNSFKPNPLRSFKTPSGFLGGSA
jgi:hypothetical protein